MINDTGAFLGRVFAKSTKLAIHITNQAFTFCTVRFIDLKRPSFLTFDLLQFQYSSVADHEGLERFLPQVNCQLRFCPPREVLSHHKAGPRLAKGMLSISLPVSPHLHT